ncbi:MAG: hypothetical protein WC464_01745 [Bdellovibrionales bacterium]
MGIKQQTEHLNWLSATLAAQRNNLSDLLARLRGVAFKVGDSLSIHKKFVKFIDQVAIEREKELDILYEIETVEKQHLALKKLKRLRHADVAAENKRQRNKKLLLDEDADKKDPERVSLVELFLLYWFFFSHPTFFSFLGSSWAKPLSGDPTPQPKADKIEPQVE